MTTYHSLEAGGLNIFYREAGNPDRPVILLLHGFPSEFHLFRPVPKLLRKIYLTPRFICWIPGTLHWKHMPMKLENEC